MQEVICCPHCRGQVLNDGTLSGQIVACPLCGGRFQMPLLLASAGMAENVRCVRCGTENCIRVRGPNDRPLCGKCLAPLPSSHEGTGQGSASISAVTNACVICGRLAPSGIALCNGTVYHHECYAWLQERLNQLTVAQREDEVRRARSEAAIAEAQTTWYAIRSFLVGPNIDVEWHRRAIVESQNTTARSRTEATQIRAQLRAIWDFWPTYPPDWEERKEAVLEASNHKCQRCGATRVSLHVHHIRRIGKGGSHRPENLEAACARCHGQEHGKDFEKREFSPGAKPSAYTQRVELIRRAIEEGRVIRFSYKTFDGEKSARSLTPRLLKQVGQSLCVEGWCHLRKDTRSFAIQRMRGVKLVDGGA